jgi:outer membrane protein TolC
MRIRLSLLIGFLLVAILYVTPLLGDNLFSRYVRDQETRSVRLEARRTAGRFEDGKRYLAERDAIEMALVNNLDINVERHSSLSSAWEVALQESFYDPKGMFGYDFNRITIPTTSILQGGTSLTDILSGYDFGYQHPFSTGTAVEFNFVGNRNETTNFFADFVPAINTELHFLVRQDLLRGFGKSAAEYEIAIGRNNLDISGQEFRRKATDIIVQIQERFWELKAALKVVEVREKAFEYAHTVLEQNRARFEVGTAARLEVVQAEAELASRKEELVRAQFTYRRVQDQLVRLITDFEDPRDFAGEIIPVVEGSQPNPLNKDFDELLAIASEMRPELQQADLQQENLEVRYQQSRDRLRPNLDLVAGYQQVGLGGIRILRDYEQGLFPAPITGVIPGGLGDSLRQLFGADFRGFVVGLDLQLPLSNSESKAQNAKAQIELRRARLEKQATRQAIALEIRDAMTQVEMNEARLEASKVAVTAAEERLRGEEARFEVGLGTTRELIEAQRDLLQTVSVQVRAEMDLRKSHAQLDKAIGHTFERHNIVLLDAMETNVR